MVAVHGQRTAMPRLESFAIEPIADLAAIQAARARVAELHLSDPVLDYIVDLTRATRSHPALYCGASPRAATMLACAARSWAALSGEEFVLPDAVKDLAVNVLAHRVILGPAAEMEGRTVVSTIREILDQVPVPR